ncbi:hypothetical protein OIO90_004956 [Microbotryomycetes sp. JL221]|nr:hypothetical protein OIO90_004956 [Microbotryomycetes sp. JL221]
MQAALTHSTAPPSIHSTSTLTMNPSTTDERGPTLTNTSPNAVGHRGGAPRSSSTGAAQHQHSHQQEQQGSPRKQSTLMTQQHNAAELDKKAKAAKDLSHVPCKFFKANSCTAGTDCPFSHDVAQPGVAKPLCQWYQKGSCRFGHKCALAHVLPGQPMSFDRKNKRAAQAALREAQAQAVNVAQSGTIDDFGTSTPPLSLPINRHPEAFVTDSNNLHNQSGLTKSLLNAVGEHQPTTASLDSWPTFGNGVDGNATIKATQFASVVGQGLSPSYQYATSPSQSATTSQPSGLSQTFSNGAGGASGAGNRSSMAAQIMLGEQARRFSNNSETLSPPRPYPQPRLPSYSGSNGLDQTSPSIFGTSPFQGSRGLFMPSSFDSNEDLFPRSPPNHSQQSHRNGFLTDMRRSSSNNGTRDVMDDFAVDAQEDDQEGGDNSDDYDEAFLPSSLNDLLTPEEQRRRASKVIGSKPSDLLSTVMGLSCSPSMTTIPSTTADMSTTSAGRSGDIKSQSVPTEIKLARGPRQPVMSTSKPSFISNSSIEGTNPHAASFTPTSPPISTANVTSYSPSTSSRLASRSKMTTSSSTLPWLTTTTTTTTTTGPVYSSSFDIRSTTSSSFLKPGLTTTLPGSLPGGLAAGLSQLHLKPANHTGNTPPAVTSLLLSTSLETTTTNETSLSSSSLSSSSLLSSKLNQSHLKQNGAVDRTVVGSTNHVVPHTSVNELDQNQITIDEPKSKQVEQDVGEIRTNVNRTNLINTTKLSRLDHDIDQIDLKQDQTMTVMDSTRKLGNGSNSGGNESVTSGESDVDDIQFTFDP